MKYQIVLTFILLARLMYGEVMTSGADFLKIDIGGRETGMGGATSSLVDDVEALDVNMGGLSRLNNSQLFLEHAEWLDNVRFETVSLASPLPALHGAFGINAKYLYITPFDSYDDWGLSVKKVDYSCMQLKTGYSMRIIENSSVVLGVGLGASVIHVQLDDTGYYAPSADAGVLFTYYIKDPLITQILGTRLNLSYVAKNIGFVNDSDKEKLPLVMKCGMGLKFFNFLDTGIDVVKLEGATWGLNAGAEFYLWDTIALRGGVKLGVKQLNSFIPGIGIKYKLFGNDFYFDYSMTPLSRDLGMSHRVSVKMDFGKAPNRTPEGQIWYYQGIYHFTHNEYEAAIAVWEKIPKEDTLNYPKGQSRIAETREIIENERALRSDLKKLEKNYENSRKNGEKGKQQ